MSGCTPLAKDSALIELPNHDDFFGTSGSLLNLRIMSSVNASMAGCCEQNQTIRGNLLTFHAPHLIPAVTHTSESVILMVHTGPLCLPVFCIEDKAHASGLCPRADSDEVLAKLPKNGDIGLCQRSTNGGRREYV